MNKKAFIGATLFTATVVGGVVYYRHQLRARVEKLLDDVDEKTNEFLARVPGYVQELERIQRTLTENRKQEPTA